MTALDWVRSRVDPSTATGLFLVGDLLAIAVFVVMGEISHDYPLLSMRVLGTYAQFLLGWLVVAIPAGVYAADYRRDLTRSTVLVLGAWLGADVVAQGLRSTAVFPGNAALTFGIVAFLVGGVLLVAWRLTFAVVTSRRQSTVPA
ncbi:Protein of unknown function [Halorientalis persicus]|jgi:glucose-6-phosphate-specific signal transduction histidine kinase|uniref:DUF3054 domain-containing protein n=1 Tax=Halorientalis persicus TaxID=1367881 RepID=A0A1H8LYP6_9EURY|nr:DUF3054 domain-containing protein [Halorientalis persicus]SEO10243.1 Protein of unknown function [Halorientalis persicus]